jgi:DNA-directed RNA polymerase subunit RPC12/RpoP
VGASFAYGLLDTDIDIPCPQCGYPIWIRLVEAVVQAAVRCPACRSRIWLVDDRGSVRNAGEEIERTIREMFS